MLVSEVVVINDPPGDISVSTWQAMSLERALVTRSKRLSIRLLCTITFQLQVSIWFHEQCWRETFREMYNLPLTPGRSGCQCSTSLWLHCTANETSVLLRLEWSDPLSCEKKKQNKKETANRTAFSVLRYIKVSSVIPDRLSSIHLHASTRLGLVKQRVVVLHLTLVYYFPYLGDCRY